MVTAMDKRKCRWSRFSLFAFLLSGVVTWKVFFSSTTYFESFPVQFSSLNHPMIDVEIEESSFPLLFDSGAAFQMSMQKELLENLQKNPCGKQICLNLKGEQSENLRFALPQVKLNSLIFENVVTLANTYDRGVTFWEVEKPSSSLKSKGYIGLKLIKERNWLIDLRHSVIMASNSPKELRKRGYDLDHFWEVPFKLERLGIFFPVLTDIGTLHLLLDTCCTCSLINGLHFSEEKNASETTCHGMPVFNSKKFMLNDYDFGEQSLNFFDITDKKEFSNVDGVIGVDFLKKHAVYLDFSKNVAYIEKN